MTRPPFALDARLAADTVLLASTPNSQLLLMDDARWPWMILVPQVPGATEMHGLLPAVRSAVRLEIDRTAHALQLVTGCRSINVAALGNVVSQLHVHVVARNDGDPNWPRPVWGFGNAERRRDAAVPEFALRVLATLNEGFPDEAGRFVVPE